MILAYLKIYKFSTQNIRSNIHNRNFRILCIGLKRYNSKTRKIILENLKGTKIEEKFLIKRLIKIIKNDFLETAEKALTILKENTTVTEKYAPLFAQAQNIYLDRLRRQENKRAFFKTHKPKTNGKLIDKSKMQQLELVRQQLKKSIRMH